jgi:hypothetical protein
MAERRTRHTAEVKPDRLDAGDRIRLMVLACITLEPSARRITVSPATPRGLAENCRIRLRTASFAIKFRLNLMVTRWSDGPNEYAESHRFLRYYVASATRPNLAGAAPATTYI